MNSKKNIIGEYFIKNGCTFKKDGRNNPIRIMYGTAIPTKILVTNNNEQLICFDVLTNAGQEISMCVSSGILNSSSIISAFAEKGVGIVSSCVNEVKEMINRCIHEMILPIVHTVENFGWIPDKQVFLPYLNGEGTYELCAEVQNTPLAAGLVAVGSLDTWTRFMAPLRTNPIFRFILGTAAAAPLLHFLNTRSFITYIYCASGSGKTAALSAAASIFGSPKELLVSFNATDAGLERIVSMLKNLPLFLDERQFAVGNHGDAFTERVAFLIANETGRLRGNKDGGIEMPHRWETTTISTGEVKLFSSSSANGMSNRVISLSDVPFDNDFDPSTIYSFVQLNYGLAAKPLLEAIVSMGEAGIKKKYSAFEQFLSDKCDRSIRDHIAYIASVMTADFLLSTSTFKEAEEDAMNQSYEMGIAIAEQVKKSLRSVEIEGICAIVDWFESNPSSFVGVERSLSSSAKQYGRYDSAKDELSIVPSELNHMLGDAGFNSNQIVCFLKKNNLLIAEKNKNTVKRRIGKTETRVYCVRLKQVNAFISAKSEAKD